MSEWQQVEVQVIYRPHRFLTRPLRLCSMQVPPQTTPKPKGKAKGKAKAKAAEKPKSAPKAAGKAKSQSSKKRPAAAMEADGGKGSICQS